MQFFSSALLPNQNKKTAIANVCRAVKQIVFFSMPPSVRRVEMDQSSPRESLLSQFHKLQTNMAERKRGCRSKDGRMTDPCLSVGAS
jgi:hypothetical protein